MPSFKVSILGVFLLACLLRLWGLFSYDLWFDELGTNLFAYPSIHRMADLSHVAWFSIFKTRLANDPHSSLYYQLIYYFSQFAGDGKILRVLSVIFSLATLGIFYRVARILFDQRVSFYALVIMALNPFHIWYAQEARVYALAGFLSLFMLYAFFAAMRDNKWWQWIGFGVSGALALMATYFNVFLLALLPLYVKFGPHKHRMKSWFFAMVLMGLCFTPYLSLMVAQLEFVQKDFWLPAPSFVTVLFTALVFSLGYSGSIVQYAAGLVVFGLLIGVGSYRLLMTDRLKGIFLLLLLFVPLVLVYIVSHAYTPVYIQRQLLILSPVFYLLVAKGVDALPEQRDRWVAMGAIVVLLASCLFNYYNNYMFEHRSRALYFTGVVPKKNYLEQFDYIRKNYTEGDIIAVTDTQAHVMLFSYVLDNYDKKSAIGFENLRYFLYPQLLQRFDNRFLRIQDLVAHIPEDKIYNMQTFIPSPNGAMVIDATEFEDQDFQRIWLVSASWHLKGEERQVLSVNAMHVRAIFERIFGRTSQRIKDGVYVELYEK